MAVRTLHEARREEAHDGQLCIPSHAIICKEGYRLHINPIS